MQTSRLVKRRANRLFRWCLPDGRLDEGRTRQLVQHVLGTGGRDGAAVLSHVLRLVRLHRARHTARIESATPLPGDLRAQVEAALRETYGPELDVAFAVAPSLIGGMRVVVAHDVYDGSVRAALAALERGF